MARKYQVEGTNDFLIAAIVLLGFGLWCLKDGWFPSAEVETRHPRVVSLSLDRPGILAEVLVAENHAVNTNQVVARLVADEPDRTLTAAETDYVAAADRLKEAETALRKGEAVPPAAEAVAALRDALQAAAAAETRADEARQKARDERAKFEFRVPKMGDETSARVAAVRKKKGEYAEAGEVVFVLHPEGHFYPFNKSLAFLTIVGAIVCAIVHRAVR